MRILYFLSLFALISSSCFTVNPVRRSAAQSDQATSDAQDAAAKQKAAEVKLASRIKKLAQFDANLKKPDHAILEEKTNLQQKRATLTAKITAAAGEAGKPAPSMQTWEQVANSVTWVKKAEIENRALNAYVNRFIKGKKVPESDEEKLKTKVEKYIADITAGGMTPLYSSWGQVKNLAAGWINVADELTDFAARVRGKHISLARKPDYEQKVNAIIGRITASGKTAPTTWAAIDASIVWQDPAALADSYAAKTKQLYQELSNSSLQMPQEDIDKLVTKYQKARAGAVEGKPEYGKSFPAQPDVLIKVGPYQKGLLQKTAKTGAERDLDASIKKLNAINDRLKKGVTEAQSQTLITSFNNTSEKARASIQELEKSGKKAPSLPLLAKPKIVSEDDAIKKELAAIKTIDAKLTSSIPLGVTAEKQEAARLNLVAQREKAERNIAAINPDAVSRIPAKPAQAYVNNASAREEERQQQAEDKALKAQQKAEEKAQKKAEKAEQEAQDSKLSKENKELKEKLDESKKQQGMQQGMGMGGMGAGAGMGMMGMGMMGMGGGMMGPGMGMMGGAAMMGGAGMMVAGAGAGAGMGVMGGGLAAGRNDTKKEFAPIQKPVDTDFVDIYEPSKEIVDKPELIGPALPDAFDQLPVPTGIYTEEKIKALFALEKLLLIDPWDDKNSELDDLTPLTPIKKIREATNPAASITGAMNTFTAKTAQASALAGALATTTTAMTANQTAPAA